MSVCVLPQAFLSALVGRAQREGYEPTAHDLASVLALGCSRAEILARYETVGEPLYARVRALLAGVPDPPRKPAKR